MSEEIHKIHDHFFKMAMKDFRVVREFFEMHLPMEIQEEIQWQTLQSHTTVQNSQLYREDITDIAFKVMLQEEMMFLHVIIDHQSTPDPMMAGLSD